MNLSHFGGSIYICAYKFRVKHSGTTRWCYLIVLPYYASMAAVAGLHLNDCPAEDMIPVVVLANGALTIVYCLAMFAQSRWPTNSALNCFGGLLHFAKFALTIVVAVYFFMNFPPKHLNDPVWIISLYAKCNEIF